MEEENLKIDIDQLLEAATDFALYLDVHSEASVKQFVDRFPIPTIISVLQTRREPSNLEVILTTCLEKIFATKYGVSLVPEFLGFIVMGLKADSEEGRIAACKTVSSFLKNAEENTSAPQLLLDHGIYPLLLDCLINGDSRVSTASVNAIIDLAGSPEGMAAIFPVNEQEPEHLKNVAARGTSVARVRVFSLVSKLFSISSSTAAVVYKSNLLNLIIEQVNDMEDSIVTSTILELLYEIHLAEVQHGTEFLLKKNLFQILTSIIGNLSAKSELRERAMIIVGRLIPEENAFTCIDESSIKSYLSVISGRTGLFWNKDADETEFADENECAFWTLAQIGSSFQGALLLLQSPSPIMRHVINTAFDQHARHKQLAALHALGNISGETRPQHKRILNVDAEENLKNLMYETASSTWKHTPSGLLLSVLRQGPEFCLAGYRVIEGMVCRPWCLMEICSRQEIIESVINTNKDTSKQGLEASYKCCQAILSALTSSGNVHNDDALTQITMKLDEVVRRGPYLARKNVGAQPLVMTAERF
ncbi:uncharacterized protein LOC124910311 [Impatiens glandulifera]|uniref:uncharacterized protein LOC124910311 n=1 Tax=Impatiens glandulifera TaxID=253017 RepID=UPI001FB05ECF|nr:uncharacterized protein LOC124910311 [Impatiens glandulifera]